MQEGDDPHGGGPGGTGGGQNVYTLIGYAEDGRPVYSHNGQGQFVVGANGYEAYTGQLLQQPPERDGDSGAHHPGGTAGSPEGAPPPPTGSMGGAPPADLIAPYTEPFTPPDATPLPGAPAPPNIPAFTAPSLAEAMNDPGYKFSVDEGNRNLSNWMAAHGTFNDSTAARALYDYGANAAQSRYSDVWGRAYNTYNTNVQTQYLDPWQQQFQNYSTTAPLIQHANDMNWQNAFNRWIQDWNIWKDQRDSTFSKQYQVATS